MAYAGDLKPTEAWKLLAEDKKAQLVDVRTHTYGVSLTWNR